MQLHTHTWLKKINFFCMEFFSWNPINFQIFFAEYKNTILTFSTIFYNFWTQKKLNSKLQKPAKNPLTKRRARLYFKFKPLKLDAVIGKQFRNAVTQPFMSFLKIIYLDSLLWNWHSKIFSHFLLNGHSAAAGGEREHTIRFN